jgi:phosphoglycerate dehydrogenase-like enzyme
MKYQVFIVDSAEVPHGEDDELEREELRDCAKVKLLRLNAEEDFAPFASSADAIILWHHLQLTSATLTKLQKTRLIVRNGVGFDNVDIAAAATAGVAVANVPDYGTEEVADHAITLALALVRQIKPLMLDVSGGRWEWKTGLNCRRVSELKFGIIGCGRIGTATALRAKALGFKVGFFDPYLPSGYDKAIGIPRIATLEELLTNSDLISVHTPLTSETRHLIGAREFERMKPSAYLINTARGGVVSYDALLAALTSDRIQGAGLDVLEDEPFGAERLSQFRNCIVTPHSAFYSQESLAEMRRKSARIVKDALLHDRYRNVVNGVRAQSATFPSQFTPMVEAENGRQANGS